MLTKFRNKLQDVGAAIAIPLFILLLPALLVGALFMVIFHSKKAAQFKQNYAKWLEEHEGEEFFCYTNRSNSVKQVEEHILPALDSTVHIIKLMGKKPQTNLDERFISHALYHLNNVGFPNVMKITNNKMCDISIHAETYNALNQGLPTTLADIMLDATSKLSVIAQQK